MNTLLTLAALFCAAARADGLAEASAPKASGSMSQSARLSAELVDKERLAAKRAAAVLVKVTGVQLGEGRAHLHYKIDGGPTIDTAATKLGFQDLAPGEHAIMVMLSGGDHAALGPSETLTVTVP